ncbi:MAG: AAA family ATPase, partial [Planctomycetota bacterium]|nr:AAA family ATPase [Planctomycetota bacterium]
MILHSLQAKNFMKYRSIRIAKLPTTGLIGIIGDNESGKTTLGHAILFSLFGEAPDGDVHRLIHWDEDQMKVGLEFTAEGHGRFVVYREIDRRGTNYVKLRNTDDEKDSCSGVMAVEARMKRILGVSAEEFKVSFFMAQKDVDFLR